MYGVIDIGSNTIRFMIYHLQQGTLCPMLNQKATAGLASYIEKKKIRPEGIQEAVRILREFKQAADMIHLEKLWAFGTAPFRSISNAQEVVQAIQDECGIQVQILSGREEALLDYYGALYTSAMKDGLLLDVGGGSSELVFCQNKKPVFAASVPLGSLNSYTSHVKNIFPSPEELRAVKNDFQKQLEALSFPSNLSQPPIICSIGGTARTILKIYNAWHHGAPLNLQYSCTFFDECFDMLQNNPSHLKKSILRMAPERIHTLLPGMAIFDTAARFFHCPAVTTSRCGVREGFLYYILNEKNSGAIDFSL